MSRSPHRLRADASETWRSLLFGEIVRALDAPVQVRDELDVRLPRSGRWETGLARIRPALDDALGATALAVAWRTCSVALGQNAWPSLVSLARTATDRPVSARQGGPLACSVVDGEAVVVDEGAGTELSQAWILRLPGDQIARIGVRGRVHEAKFVEIDRVADIACAWLGGEWRLAKTNDV